MTDENHLAEEDICPHLGSTHDAELRYLFANPIHICLHSKTKGGITFEHQEEFCVTNNHIACPLFENINSKSSPGFIRKPEAARTGKKRSKWIWLSAVLLVLIVGGVGLSIYMGGNETRTGRFSIIMSDSPTPEVISREPTETPTPLPTSTATLPPTETLTPTSRPSNTPVPTETEIVPPTPGPNLGTPFGNYVLHRVKTGESLAAIANIYQVPSERITAVNIILESRGVWARDVLVIPIGAETENTILRFEYIFIEKKTKLSTLTETYAVTVEDLREYNLLGSLDWVPAGRWLIIPVVGE